MKRYLLSALMGVALACPLQAADEGPYNVLVVMSYEEQNPWCKEIKAGIESSLGTHATATYFYMDTKVDPKNGPAKAKQAYATYQKLQPDGIIAVDDNAQSMFVVPSLKDKVSTPVMFAGVNSNAGKYGYPNSHISGILERAHVHESLAFAKQLMPKIQNACFLTNDVPSGRALQTQVMAERKAYPVKVHDFYLIKSTTELNSVRDEMGQACDALFVDSLEGIVDENKEPLANSEILKRLDVSYDGALLGGNRYQVEQGAWAAVVKTGQEQGETSAEMLLAAMRGKDLAAIPVVQNTRGERVVNVTALDEHQISLKPLVLRGATLVRQQP